MLILPSQNGMNGFVLGNIAQKLNKVDRHVTSAIQGHLFEEEGDGWVNHDIVHEASFAWRLGMRQMTGHVRQLMHRVIVIL